MKLPEPSNKFRPAPFWSWNADLEPDELRWQIRQMHEAGIGGFFMHARGGLETEYLSEKWMQCVSASLNEAGKLGMDAWLYDENGWPSGFAGGLVNGLGEKYQAKYLRCEVIDSSAAKEKCCTLGFYTKDGAKFLGTVLPQNHSGEILRCFYEINPYYVDNLDRNVVAEFLRVTHEHYYKHIPSENLKHLRGIFTDEPQLSRKGIPWSLIIADEYLKKYNEDLIPLLPALLLDLPCSPQTRIRFWKLCADVFSQSFMKQIHDWCIAHNWELTGHHVLEEYFYYQIPSNGAIMPQYRYYTLPGVDHLCRQMPSNVAAIQLVSAAQQYGLRQTLTESFGLTGWACNFTGMRWIYQQQMAHGINYLCQHLQSYSLRGSRKRDYPQSSFYHQPWWKDYKILNDYFSKTGNILAEGEITVDTLVIHPLSSTWKLECGKYNINTPAQTSLEKISTELDCRLIQYHYADEVICDECGDINGKNFTIGKCSYQNVIIPRLTNLSRKIFELLKKFRRNGGNIIRIKENERLGEFTIDGIPATAEEKDFLNSLLSVGSEKAAAELAAALLPDNPAVRENGILCHEITGTWRDIEIDSHRGRFYYLVNTNYRSGINAEVILPAVGKHIALISQENGIFYRIDAVTDAEKKFHFKYNFCAADALMLFISDTIDPMTFAPFKRINDSSTPVRCLNSKWQISDASANIITLDKCRFRTAGGTWHQAISAIDVQTRLLQLQKEVEVELEYDFFIDESFDFSSQLYIAAESPEIFTFSLNGTPFAAIDKGYLFDKAFRKIPIPRVAAGKNTIGMKFNFVQSPGIYDIIEKAKKFESEHNKITFATEIESIYLCGNFSVIHDGQVVKIDKDASRFSGTFALASPLKNSIVNINDLTENGLPFFAGSLTLKNSFTLTEQEIKNISFLTFDLKGANSAKVKINGQYCGTVFWEPYAVDVTGKLTEGINIVEIELVISLRNMLGPHHLAEGESYIVSTLSFNCEPTIFSKSISETVDSYCMVDFGVRDIKFTS